MPLSPARRIVDAIDCLSDSELVEVAQLLVDWDAKKAIDLRDALDEAVMG